MGINWDAAGIASDIAAGGGWSGVPWNSHYGLTQAYLFGIWTAQIFGGTLLDGLRLLNAVAFAVAATLIALTANILCGSRWLSILICGVALTAWGMLILVLTWEDNVLYLPAGTFAIYWGLRRLGHWRGIDSVMVGAVVGFGSLMSWQAAMFLFPPLYLATFLGGSHRAWPLRVRDFVAVVLAFLSARVSWAFFLWATGSKASLHRLLEILFSRPSPSFFPQGLTGWLNLSNQVGTVFQHLGHGLSHEVGPTLRDAAMMRPLEPFIGAAFLVACLAGCIGSAVRLRKSPRAEGHYIVACLTAFILSAAIYLDLMVDKYKRYEFVPIMLVLLLASSCGWIRKQWPTKRMMVFLASPLMMLVGSQAAIAFHWDRAWHQNLPLTTPKNYEGRNQESWYQYMRRVRSENPRACSFVFSFEELAHARYKLEIRAAVLSELPAPIIIGDPARVRGWPRPLPVRTLNDFNRQRRNCEWLSDDARRLAGIPTDRG